MGARDDRKAGVEFRVVLTSICQSAIAFALASAAFTSPASAQKASQKTAKKSAKASKAPSSSDEQKQSGLPGWFKMVRIVDAESSASLGEASALAIDDRYLVVPWRFISQVRATNARVRYIVADSGQEARLLDADTFSGIALLRASSFLFPSMARAQIRTDNPEAGEALVSLQAAHLPHVRSRVSRVQSDGAVQRLRIEGETLEGVDRSAYHFDRFGRLVGVSYGKDAAGLSRAVSDLLRRHDGPRPAAVDHLDLKKRQLVYWQDRQIQLLSPLRSLLSLKHLDCRLHIPSVADKKTAAYVKNARSKSCETPLPVTVAGDYSMGARFWSQEVTLNGVSDDIEERLVQALSAEAFAEHDKSSALVGLMTPSDCRENVIKNTQGRKVRVRFCTSALKVEPSLSDTIIAAGAIDGRDKAFINVARLRGFNQTNTKRVIEALIENIGVSP